MCQWLSQVQLFAIPWAAALQAPLAMGFSRQEYWSGLPFPSAGDLPNPGIEPGSPVLQATLYQLSHQESPYYSRYLEKSLQGILDITLSQEHGELKSGFNLVFLESSIPITGSSIFNGRFFSEDRLILMKNNNEPYGSTKMLFPDFFFF